MKSMMRSDTVVDGDQQLLRRQSIMPRSYTQVSGGPPEAWSPTELVDVRFKMCKKISELTMVVHLLFKYVPLISIYM